MAERTHGSSSSSFSHSSTNYDVFLSFSGRDTRKTFTSYLYTALVQAGIQTFMDEEGFEKGEEIAPILEKAIAESRISIPIFSEHYASSKWCLNELLKIMESRATMGQTVFPIFYCVSPRDVRRQTAGFGQQFDKLAKNSDPEKVESWKRALKQAASLTGWDLKNIDSGNEPMLIHKVVGHVLSELSQDSIYINKYSVGIDSSVMSVLNLLDVESNDVQFVGILGMGGIGKTTIAKAVFNRICRTFEGSTFLDVREGSKQLGGLVRLQSQLISDTQKQKIRPISDVNKGKIFIKNYLRAKKVLIFLDDVDRSEQLQVLAGGHDWFGSGSRIIIITRDEHVLNSHGVFKIYRPKELDFDQSLQLFSLHTFGKDQPPEDFVKPAKDVIRIAGGLPLAVEVLGSFLYDKRSPELWRSTLHRLTKIPIQEVQTILKISYDELGELEKEIFLDIACFFIGMDKEYATDILEGCGFQARTGIIILIERSLVKIDNHNKLTMHDLLRDMGRHIVRQESPREPGKRSRLWSREEVLNVLVNQEGTTDVKGIVYKLGEETALEKILVSTEAFEMMSKLRLLQIDNAHLEGDFKKLPSELRWFSWKGCPLKYIPTDFHLEKLSVLDLSYSRIKQVVTDLDQNKQFQELKVLDLSYCRYLTKAPSFSKLPNLEKLNLEGCIRLKALPSSICNLKSLKKLILSGCSNLNKLPNLHGSLNQLEVLKLEDCKLLVTLPDWINSMRNLKSLSLDGTLITELPEAVALLEKMEELTLHNCKELVKLPYSMGKMRLLRRLVIDGTGIVKLPKDFGMLTSLEVLSMSHCQEFRRFPENFGRLVQLRDLDVRGSSKLCILQDSFSDLCSLTSLDASCCSLIGIPSDFGKLSSLEKLNLSDNDFLNLPGSISALSRLEHLGLDNCTNLQSLPELPSSLRILNVKNCISMEISLNLSYLKNLQTLDLSNCRKLVEIQGIEKMESLQELWMSGCSRALVDSAKKNLGQSLLQRLHLCSFPGSEIPYWFTPTRKVSNTLIWNEKRNEIRLECEELPTRFWNLEQHRKIMGVVLCFVFTNSSEISLITLTVQVEGSDGLLYSKSAYPFVISSKWHQDQICLCQFCDRFGNFVSELGEGDEISFTIQTEPEMEVKKGGMYVVYEDTKSTFESRGNFLTLSYDDDVDDDVDDDDVDDDDVDDDGHFDRGGPSDRKRKKSIFW